MLPVAKLWVETKTRKKQEWLFILMVDGVAGKEQNEVRDSLSYGDR